VDEATAAHDRNWEGIVVKKNILAINLTTHVVDSSVYPGSGVLAL
jgi:hypothetical protein